MADVHSAKQRSYNMSQIRGKDTKPEKLVRSMLRADGFRCRYHVANLPGKPDIVPVGGRTAIFVHGCFWHRHRNCKYATDPKQNAKFWRTKFSRTVERDSEHAKALRRAKWRVVIVWECELRQNPERIRRRLLKILI